MKIIEKFVIDRDSEEYFYGEKIIGEFNNIIYRIYYSYTSFDSLNTFEFSEIYGNYYRLTVAEFISLATYDLGGYNENNLLHNFKLLRRKYNTINYNPYINKDKKVLITSIYYYDELIKDRALIEDFSYDYEKDMEKLLLPYDEKLLRIKEDNLSNIKN